MFARFLMTVPKHDVTKVSVSQTFIDGFSNILTEDSKLILDKILKDSHHYLPSFF